MGAVHRYAGRHRFIPEPVMRLPMRIRLGIVVALAIAMTVAGLLVSGGTPDRLAAPAPSRARPAPIAPTPTASTPAGPTTVGPTPVGATPVGPSGAVPTEQLRQRLSAVTNERTAVQAALARLQRLAAQLADAGLPLGSETTALRRELQKKDTALATDQQAINRAINNQPT